jgi:uncharacterized protein YbbC (DUF1343 family)
MMKLPFVALFLALAPFASAQTDASAASSSAPAATAPASVPAPAPAPVPPPAFTGVELGIDVLAANHFQGLEGKRVGLLTNQSGVNRYGISTIDVLRGAPNVQLVALYAPEHGVYGADLAGADVANAKDARTGLPVFSLYGDTRKPTPDMLKGIDVLVFDIQDIGCRSYTFISSMGLAMEACGEAGKEFYVLDRPNPLGGSRVEGMALDPKFRSFVGQWDIPYIHGLTVGELAYMIHDEKWIKARPKLTVVPMRGWTRDMTWNDSKLIWVPPSPHIPTPESALNYAVTGLWGEFPALNNGVGYTLPFSLIGAADIDRYALQKAMNRRNLAGFVFIPTLYKPFYGSLRDLLLSGLQVRYSDSAHADLMAGAMGLIEEIQKQYGHDLFTQLSPEKAAFFDKLCGGDSVRLHLTAQKPVQDLIDSWQPYLDDFKARRAKYLLYK